MAADTTLIFNEIRLLSRAEIGVKFYIRSLVSQKTKNKVNKFNMAGLYMCNVN